MNTGYHRDTAPHNCHRLSTGESFNNVEYVRKWRQPDVNVTLTALNLAVRRRLMSQIHVLT